MADVPGRSCLFPGCTTKVLSPANRARKQELRFTIAHIWTGADQPDGLHRSKVIDSSERAEMIKGFTHWRDPPARRLCTRSGSLSKRLSGELLKSWRHKTGRVDCEDCMHARRKLSAPNRGSDSMAAELSRLRRRAQTDEVNYRMKGGN